LTICHVDLGSHKKLTFNYPGDQVIYLEVPKDFEIIKTHMVIKGQRFTGDVFKEQSGVTVSVKTEGSSKYTNISQDKYIPFKNKNNVTAIIIDFHTPRTVTGLELVKMTFAKLLEDVFCIVRVGSSGSWFLPAPKNLFAPRIKNKTLYIKEPLPEITAEMLMLTFARLEDKDGKFITHDQTNGNLYALGEIKVHEYPLISLNQLSIFTSDSLADFYIRVGDTPPFFYRQGEFFTRDEDYYLPDFSKQINRYMQEGAASVPLTFHTERSGVLEITKFDLDYVRHHRAFKLEGEDQSSEEAKTLIFEWDPRRSGSIVRNVSVNLESPGEINFISLKLEGNFSRQRLIPGPGIQQEISTGDKKDALLGFQLVPGKMAAQKVKLTGTFKITGIDLAMKFLDEKVNFTVELRTDENNQPGEKILVSKEITNDSPSIDGPSPVRDFAWVQVDFEEEIKITKGTYWIVLGSTEGEIVWQITDNTGMNFFYTYTDRNPGWSPLSDSYAKEVRAVYCLRHTPLQFDNPLLLQIKPGDNVIGELARDDGSIDILIEKKVNISNLSGSSQPVTLAFEAKSAGTLKISDLLIKYSEMNGRGIQMKKEGTGDRQD
jgi:hypothetical protein